MVYKKTSKYIAELTLSPFSRIDSVDQEELVEELDSLEKSLPKPLPENPTSCLNEEQKDAIGIAIWQMGLLWCCENRRKFELGLIKIKVKFAPEFSIEEIDTILEGIDTILEIDIPFLCVLAVVTANEAMPDILSQHIKEIPEEYHKDILGHKKAKLFVSKETESGQIIFSIK